MVDALGKPYKKVNQLEMEENEQSTEATGSSEDSVAKLVNTLNW
jgi:hypothetical protein